MPCTSPPGKGLCRKPDSLSRKSKPFIGQLDIQEEHIGLALVYHRQVSKPTERASQHLHSIFRFNKSAKALPEDLSSSMITTFIHLIILFIFKFRKSCYITNPSGMHTCARHPATLPSSAFRFCSEKVILWRLCSFTTARVWVMIPSPVRFLPFWRISNPLPLSSTETTV